MAAAAERSFYSSALRRIARNTAALAAAGCLAGLLLRGWKWALAYLLGAAASTLNFYWLKRMADGVAGAAKVRPSSKFAVLIGLRYVVLAAGAYAILNFTSLSLPAALIGLFVPVAAVILEMIFQLIYAP